MNTKFLFYLSNSLEFMMQWTVLVSCLLIVVNHTKRKSNFFIFKFIFAFIFLLVCLCISNGDRKKLKRRRFHKSFKKRLNNFLPTYNNRWAVSNRNFHLIFHENISNTSFKIHKLMSRCKTKKNVECNWIQCWFGRRRAFDWCGHENF